MSLQNKIDMAIIFSVKNANPNGDPLNGNRPRTDYDGFGEITDVCLKRKIRDRLQDAGFSIFVQSDERKTDLMPSLKSRAESDEVGLGKIAFDSKKTTKEETAKMACEKWMDVRTFGQVFLVKAMMQQVYPSQFEDHSPFNQLLVWNQLVLRVLKLPKVLVVKEMVLKKGQILWG